MNYKQHYKNLILKAKNRELNEYTECHHIIPRCMGGTNDISNLVNLTPEEHYVAHQLLVKIYPNEVKLLHAVIKMSGNSNKRNNKLYGWLRRKFSESQTGEKNHRYGKTWSDKEKEARRQWCIKNNWRPPIRNTPHKEETKLKISLANKGKPSIKPMLGRTGELNPLYGKKRPKEVVEKIKQTQQRYYQLTNPAGKKYYLYTYELKEFCKKHDLWFTRLMSAKIKNKKYRGWFLIEINKPTPVVAKKAKSDFNPK